MLLELLHHHPDIETLPEPAFNTVPLEQNLFTAVYLEAAMQQGRLFALLDAVEHEFDVPGIAAQAAQEHPDNGCCLYTGKAQEEFGHFTPHIVRVTPTTRELIRQKCWQDEGWGYFFTSDAKLQTIRRHFKRWLLVDKVGDGIAMFRLQDWRMQYAYYLASTPNHLNAMFGPVDEFIFASAYGPNIACYRDHSLPHRQPIGQPHKLDTKHEQNFLYLKQAEFLRRVKNFITEQIPDAMNSIPDYMVYAMLWSGLHKANHYDISGELDVAQFIMLNFLLGADFELDYPEANAILRKNISEDKRINQLYDFAQQTLTTDAVS